MEKPGLGKVLVGRGAVNTKGPQSAFLAALHAFKAAGRRSSTYTSWLQWVETWDALSSVFANTPD